MRLDRRAAFNKQGGDELLQQSGKEGKQTMRKNRFTGGSRKKHSGMAAVEKNRGTPGESMTTFGDQKPRKE